MFFHLPPSSLWNPVQLNTKLVRREIQATVVGDDIHLSFSSDSCDRWRERHAKQIARRERSSHGRDLPEACIRFHPDRFLRNLELRRDIFVVPLTEPQLATVQQSIVEMGGRLLDSAETEFEIAFRQCSNHAAITEIRLEIERLLRKKQQHIELQEFQAAADTRDKEYEVRARLDTLLLHGR